MVIDKTFSNPQQLLQGLDDETQTTTNGKRVQGGVPSTDLVLSAYMCGNADVFPQILKLHVPKNCIIADVTYGTGVFWRNVCRDDYTLLPTDISTGVDCRSLPYESGTIDCVVLDPPYMEGLLRTDKRHLAGSGTHTAFREKYSNGDETPKHRKWHNAVLDLYFEAGQPT